MAKAYNRAHALGRLSFYASGEATWRLKTWTQQLRRSAPVTRHFAVVVLDPAGAELEQIPITAQSYTALRRLLYDTPEMVKLPHTPGVEYENRSELLALKREASDLLRRASQQRERLEQDMDYVQETPGIVLSQADEYVSLARASLRGLEAAATVNELVQQVGPPLFQALYEEVAQWVAKLCTAVAEAEEFVAVTPVPQPSNGSRSEEAEPKTFLSGFSEQELLQVPSGMRFPDFPLRKKLKPVNAAYLRLLEGFHLLVRDSRWERGLYERFEVVELEGVPKQAAEFTKAEVFYLHFLHRYYTDDKGIDDAFIEHIRHYLPVRFMKHELLRHLAEL